MTKICVISDTHAGIRNDNPAILDHQKAFYDDIFFPFIKQNKIKTVVHLGDFVDRRKFINYNTLNRLRTDFLEPLQQHVQNIHVLAGNHDVYFKDTNQLSALQELLQDRYVDFKLYTKATTTVIDGVPVFLCPWICRDNETATMTALAHSEANICMGHLELYGFQVHRGTYYSREDALRPEKFEKFRTVLTGHFHHKSDYNNIHYLGCIHRKGMVRTEDGLKSIKWIVDNKYSGKVLSLDSKGKFQWKNVISHKVQPNNGTKKWISLSSNNSRKKQLICTEDHPCMIVDDILKPSLRRYEEARLIKNKYLVRYPSEKDVSIRKENKLLNATQISVAIGTLLGDATITKNTLHFTHSKFQKDYVAYKCSIMNGNISKSHRKCGYNKEVIDVYRGNITSTPQFGYLRDIGYPEGKKSVKNILELVDDIALAFWYLDDGNVLWQTKNGKRYLSGVSLNTQGFSYDDNVLIQKFFAKKYNIYLTMVEDKRNNRFYLSGYGKENFDIFFGLIAPYVPHCMEEYDYNGRLVIKLPKQYRHIPKISLDSDRLEYSAQLITDFTYWDKPGQESQLYDIEVEDTHNFVVNNSVVHNCPFQMEWGDYGDVKGFHIFDLETHNLTFIPNPYSLYYRIEYDDKDRSMDQVLNVDFEKYRKSFVRVVVRNKDNAFWFETFRDKLDAVEPLSVQVIEDLGHLAFDGDEAELLQVEDTIGLLAKYCDTIGVKDEMKPKINALLQELYKSALDVA